VTWNVGGAAEKTRDRHEKKELVHRVAERATFVIETKTFV